MMYDIICVLVYCCT